MKYKKSHCISSIKLRVIKKRKIAYIRHPVSCCFWTKQNGLLEAIAKFFIRKKNYENILLCQYMKVIFPTKRKEHVHSVEKRDCEKCMIYDRLLNHCCDVLSGHIYCSGTYFIQQDRQCTYKRNIAGRSYNHCCRGRAISTTYSEYVLVDLGIQHAQRMRHTVICGLPPSVIFVHIIS
jgi:hypothetical protein